MSPVPAKAGSAYDSLTFLMLTIIKILCFEINVYYLYILANRKYGQTYIGIAENLCKRIELHRKGRGPYYTRRYQVTKLVYFETANSLAEAMKREKQMKKWYKQWKIELIESINPKWDDLYLQIVNEAIPAFRLRLSPI